jgi:uncharacterized protein (TIGR00251 family)
MGKRPWHAIPGGVVVDVRLTPRGGRDSVDGFETLANGRVVLKARVRAAPSEGEANSALMQLIAKWANVSPSRIRIVGGATSRIKQVKIDVDSAQLIPALEMVVPAR